MLSNPTFRRLKLTYFKRSPKNMSSLTTSKAWIALQPHYNETKNYSIRDAFKIDPDRFNKFSINFNEILFDYSKNRISEDTVSLLLKNCIRTN